MPLLGHTIEGEAFHSLVQVYVKVQYQLYMEIILI